MAVKPVPKPVAPKTYAEKLELARASMKGAKHPGGLVLLGKALFFASVVFTFLAGIVFTVIPLVRSVSEYLNMALWIPLHNWVQSEPVTGPATMFLFYAAGAMLVLYILHHQFQFLYLFVMAQIEKLQNRLNKAGSAEKKKANDATVQLQRNGS